MLTAAYKAEVEYRHRLYADDNTTRANIERFARFLTRDTPKFGAMFCGICGNGKTTLLYAFQNLLNFLVDSDFLEHGVGVRVVDAKDVAGFAKEYKNLNSLKDTPMLAIEDMGREATEVLEYGNVINPVVDLLEHRYNQQLFTLITTNLAAEQVRGKYGSRVADRFNEMLEVIIFENGSYRK